MFRNEAEFTRVQQQHFNHADAKHFYWTTGGAGFSDVEDELLAPLLETIVAPCVEIGCGEGNNLVRLRRRAACVGVDLFPAKLAFAATHVPGARFVAADARALPFSDGYFKTVFIRDLLHHVHSPAGVVAEAVRVLAVGGCLCLLEPNGWNPIVRLQTYLVPAERRARESGPAQIARLLSTLPLTAIEVRTAQPLPLRRMILHYRFGLPILGRLSVSRRALIGLERFAGRFIPSSLWAYVAATARRVG
ncbi:MAG: class I SAM-dependent methyltransferase [Candidatus Binatia bacterium]